MKKRWAIIIVGGVAAVAGALFATGQITFGPTLPGYKYVMGYSDGGAIYSCSKPVKAKLTKIPSQIGDQEAKDYIPVNNDEAKLFCHSTAIIENEGKKKVLQRPEVLTLINKYQYKDVTIKALEFKYIQDKQFI